MFFVVVLSDLALKFRAAKIALKSDVFQTLLLSVLLEELVWTEVLSCVVGVLLLSREGEFSSDPGEFSTDLVQTTHFH